MYRGLILCRPLGLHSTKDNTKSRIELRLKVAIGKLTAAVAEWLRAWDTLIMFEATVSGGREFNARPGQYSRMSFHPTMTGMFSSSEHAFPSKFWIYLEHCPRGEAVIIGHLRLSSMR